MNVRSKIRSRLGEYETRTGDWLPLNVMAKVSTLSGVAIFGTEMIKSGGLKEAVLPSTLILGGIVVDKCTGGLGAPYGQKQVEQTEIN